MLWEECDRVAHRAERLYIGVSMLGSNLTWARASTGIVSNATSDRATHVTPPGSITVMIAAKNCDRALS